MSDDALEARLRRLGATPAQIETARSRGRLLALAVELIVAPHHCLTLAEVAERAGAGYDDAFRLWRAWGFPPPEPDDPRFSEVDVELVQFALAIEALVGERAALHTARVMGVAVGRIAEAEVSMIRSSIEAPLRAQGHSDDETVASFEELVPAALDMADRTLTALHGHHLVETARRHVDWSIEASPHNVLDTVVAFADLTGSTRLAAAHALDELDHALSVFEAQTSDTLASAGVTIVKRIGDAVMFTSHDPELAVRVALELVDAFAADAVVPPVRVGLAAGQVVARRGDFYGLPVVLAARLQSLALPSTVLVDTQLAERLRELDTVRLLPYGDRELSGFPDPVTVHELRWPEA